LLNKRKCFASESHHIENFQLKIAELHRHDLASMSSTAQGGVKRRLIDGVRRLNLLAKDSRQYYSVTNITECH
jgi:hypothetical protein